MDYRYHYSFFLLTNFREHELIEYLKNVGAGPSLENYPINDLQFIHYTAYYHY
jgi:hypothetical protein